MERLAVPVRTSSKSRKQFERILEGGIGYFLCNGCAFTVYDENEKDKKDKKVARRHLEPEHILDDAKGDAVGACLACGHPTSGLVGTDFLRQGVSV